MAFGFKTLAGLFNDGSGRGFRERAAEVGSIWQGPEDHAAFLDRQTAAQKEQERQRAMAELSGMFAPPGPGFPAVSAGGAGLSPPPLGHDDLHARQTAPLEPPQGALGPAPIDAEAQERRGPLAGIRSVFTDPQKLQLLGATLRDAGSGGRTNYIGDQIAMNEERSQTRRTADARERLNAIFGPGGESTLPAPSMGAPEAPIDPGVQPRRAETHFSDLPPLPAAPPDLSAYSLDNDPQGGFPRLPPRPVNPAALGQLAQSPESAFPPLPPPPPSRMESAIPQLSEALRAGVDIEPYLALLQRQDVMSYAREAGLSPEEMIALMESPDTYAAQVRDEYSPYTLRPGDIRGQGGGVVASAPNYGVDGGVAYRQNPVSGETTWGERRPASHGEQLGQAELEARLAEADRAYDLDRQRVGIQQAELNLRRRVAEMQTVPSVDQSLGQIAQKLSQGGWDSLSPGEQMLYRDRLGPDQSGLGALGGFYGDETGGFGGAGPAGGGTRQSPHRPQSEDDFERIPPGQWFVNPADGQLYEKVQ
jgi:hypothetical protein